MVLCRATSARLSRAKRVNFTEHASHHSVPSSVGERNLKPEFRYCNHGVSIEGKIKALGYPAMWTNVSPGQGFFFKIFLTGTRRESAI